MRSWLLAALLIAGCEIASVTLQPVTRLVLQPDPSLGDPSPYPSDGAMGPDGVRRPASALAASLQVPAAFSPASQVWMRFDGPALDTSNLPTDFGAAATAPITVEAGDKPIAYRTTYHESKNLLALHFKQGVGEGVRVTVRLRSTLRNVAGGPVLGPKGAPAAVPGVTYAFGYDTAVVRATYDEVFAVSAAIRELDPAPFGVYSPVALPSGAPVTALAARLPEFGWGIEAGGPDAPLDGLGAVVFGTAVLAAARDGNGTLPLAGPASALRAERVPFMLVLPDSAAIPAEVKAALGSPLQYPVVVFGHGYTACKESLLGVASRFAKEGVALLAIDAVGHGERASGKPQCGLTLTAGFGFDVTTLGGSFFDTIQQTRQLVALLPAIAARVDLSPADGTPDLAAGLAGYIGQSMGAVNGVAIASLTEGIGAAVFNVGMAGIGATIFSRGADAIPGAAFEPAGVQLDIAALDLADMRYEPLNFTAALAEKPVLVQQAEYDELIPALGSEALALALGAVQAAGDPRPVPGLASAAFPLEAPAAKHFRSVLADVDHIFLIRHDGANPAATGVAQRQAAVFLRTALSGGKLRVLAGN